MSRRSDISHGDLLDAFRELKADEATQFEIARLLGLTPFASLEELRADETADEAQDKLALDREGREFLLNYLAEEKARVERSLVGDKPPGLVDPAASEPAPADVAPDDEPVVPSRLKKIVDERVGVPRLGAEAPLLAKANAQGEARPQVFEPLLYPVWTRAILSGALSSRSDDGPLDVRRVVEKVASGEASAELPRLPRPTLARGVQVLVDRSETMLLFLKDQEWLEAEIQKVVGPERAQILYFEGCPARRAGRGSRRRWKSYYEDYLPSSGTVVLLLTDLGVGEPVSPGAHVGAQEWLDFAERLRQRGCPVVAFVPYAPSRCPAALRRLMTVVQWDRVTSASSIHARVGSGHVSSSGRAR